MDDGYDSSLGTWSPGASAPFRCNTCRALDATKYREAVIDECKNCCDPVSICKDISAASPRMLELRRATPSELRSALARVRKHLAPANTSGLEDALRQGGEGPSDRASLLLTTAQFSGAGTQAKKVAIESVDRICIGRAPRMKRKYLLPNAAQSTDKASECFRSVAKETGSPLVRAVANER